MKEVQDKIQDKYDKFGQDANLYLQGFLHSKPINYWDYIEVDTLLSLQKPKTYFADETVFIMYHQITELVFKLMLHELKQMVHPDLKDATEISLKMGRLVRYTDLLINSFSIMNQGMKYEDYNQFRLALAPASGFQSAQFRMIEIYCTPIDNLIPSLRRKTVNSGTTLEDKFQLVYWQDAGHDRVTGKKTLTLEQFEKRYLKDFVLFAQEMTDNNLDVKFSRLKEEGKITRELEQSFRNFDRKFNIEWPMVHLQTAHTYLGKGKDKKEATGGSHWEKYLHPKFQKRIFFPSVWTKEEKEIWGE